MNRSEKEISWQIQGKPVCLEENLGQKDILKGMPGGDNYDHMTQCLLFRADECEFHTESHEKALMDKINEHDNFR